MRRTLVALLACMALSGLPSGATTITVKAGDTLSDIAERYGVSVGSLMRANGLRNSNFLEAGQTLRLPESRTAGNRRHTVRSGDTLGAIAVRYRVSERQLMALNGLSSADYLEVGQTLRLPGGVTAGKGRHTVQSGDTLGGIAARYRVSERQLMALNDLASADYLEVGQTLRLPGGVASGVKAGKGRHTVRSGDTLGEIAVQYRVSERQLMALNDLASADHVEVGQRLKLPVNAVLPKPQKASKAKPVPVKAVPNASSHTVARGQTLTQIGKAYGIPVASIISLNSLENPNNVKEGTKLMLRSREAQPSATKEVRDKPASVASSKPDVKPTTQLQTSAAKPETKATTKVVTETAVRVKSADQAEPKTNAKPTAKPKPEPKAKAKPVITAKASTTKTPTESQPNEVEWKTYGPLQVDWGNWQLMGGSDVAPTLNSDGQSLYVAVNCSARKINVTGVNGSWKSWIAPQKKFERDLLNDRCKTAKG